MATQGTEPTGAGRETGMTGAKPAADAAASPTPSKPTGADAKKGELARADWAGDELTFKQADKLHRDAVRTERDAVRAFAKESRANARFKDKPNRLSLLRLTHAMKVAKKAEAEQSRAAIALDAAMAAHPGAFETNGEPFPQVEDLNPPETPRRRRFHRAIYAGLIPLLRLIVKVTYGAKVVRESDAPTTGAIVVINHCCYLDSVMTAVALWPTRLRFLALASNGYGHVWGPIVRALGTIFVGHTMAETREMLRRQNEALAAGDDLAIYPEGNLRPYETELQPFERGAFQIAVTHKAPVLPVVLVQAPGRGLIKRIMGKPGFEVHVGEPIPCPTGMRPRKAANFLQRQVRDAMEGILERGPVTKTATQRIVARIFPA